MNLDNLKWIKYINPQDDEVRAYEEWKLDSVFSLHWKVDQINNAKQVQRSDLILLLQNG